MSIQILIDMNLSPDWVALLQDAGWVATHWSTIGDPKATDRTIMDWLRDDFEAARFFPFIPHRRNRVRPSRNDSRRLRFNAFHLRPLCDAGDVCVRELQFGF